MKIAIGSDHAGFKLKEQIIKYLIRKNISFKDFGAFSEESVDYPAVAFPVANAVAAKRFDRGILICGSGVGVTIAANRVRGIRAVNPNDLYTVRQSREHGDTNILCLAGRRLKPQKAFKMVTLWLAVKFSGGKRHIKRLKMLDKNHKK